MKGGSRDALFAAGKAASCLRKLCLLIETRDSAEVISWITGKSSVGRGRQSSGKLPIADEEIRG